MGKQGTVVTKRTLNFITFPQKLEISRIPGKWQNLKNGYAFTQHWVINYI